MPDFSPKPFGQGGAPATNAALQALEARVRALENALAVTASMVTLKSGSASLVLKQNGDIAINGKELLVRTSGNIDMKSSADVVIKGSKITQN